MTEKYSEMALELFNTYGINIILALVLLIVGFIIAGWARRLVTRMLNKSERIDDTLTSFFCEPCALHCYYFHGSGGP